MTMRRGWRGSCAWEKARERRREAKRRAGASIFVRPSRSYSKSVSSGWLGTDWLRYRHEGGALSAAPKPDQRQEPSLELYRHLVHELPVTLRSSMNQQIDQWDSLFPFEQTRLSTMMDRLASLSRPAFAALIAPVRAVESKMGVRGWDFSESEDTIENASLLRSEE